MVYSTKFYIYGGGRWREVDINDGRVEGWGRAQFVYPKRGKVQLAKTQPVLSALRDLAAGRKSAVRDGAHLPFVLCEKLKRKENQHKQICEFPHHCPRSNNDVCIKFKKIEQVAPKVSIGTQCIIKTDAGIQTSLTSHTLTFPDTFNNEHIRKKRQRPTMSSEEDIPTKINTTVHSHSRPLKNSNKKLPRARTISSEGSIDGTTKKGVPSLKLERADSKKYNLYKRRRSKSNDSIIWVVLPKIKQKSSSPKKKISDYLKPKSKRIKSTHRRERSSSIEISEEQPLNKIVDSEERINNKSKKNYEKRKEQNPKVSSNEHTLTLSRSNLPTTSNTKQTRQDECKELIIDEADVDILRHYLMNREPNFDLLQFDQDDDYKKKYFFKINPLVNVERCAKIAQMLRRGSQEVISLKDFASQLGLRSVSDKTSPPKRYKMRKLDHRRSYFNRISLDSQADKENSKQYIKKSDQKNDQYRSDKIVNRTHKNENNKITVSSSTDLYTESSDENFHENSGKAVRSEKLIKEPNNDNDRGNINLKKKYTRKSNNISYKENTESSIDESKSEAIIKKTKTMTQELNKRSNKKNSNQNARTQTVENSDSTINDTDTDVDELDTPVPVNRRLVKIKKNNKESMGRIDLTITDTDTDTESFIDSKVSKPKRNNKTDKNKLQNNKNHNADSTSSKDKNKKPKLVTSKESSDKKNDKIIKKQADNEQLSTTDSDSDDSIVRKTSKPKNNDTKNNVIKRKHNISESDDNDSDFEEIKTTNKMNRSQNKAIDNTKPKERPVVRITRTNTPSKSSNKGNDKDRHRITENKNTRNSTNSSNDVSVIEDSQKPNLSNKSKQIKTNNNKNKINYINQISDQSVYSSDDDTRKASKEAKRRIQNKPSKSSAKISTEKNQREIKNKKIESKDKTQSVSKENDKNIKNKINGNVTAEALENTDEDDTFKGKASATKPEVKTIAMASKHTISKRPSRSAIREYSNLEDHAIVTWLSIGGRARCVNGNRIWTELQNQFSRVTGQSRSWHSLRNRYLRYILPSLGMMALPHVQVARLRAAAATGEIKSQKAGGGRRNSIFGAPTRGALSRRPAASRSSSEDPPPPKRHKHDNTRKAKSPTPKRTLRSSLTSPKARNHLRYSEITRNFADKHRQDESTPTQSPDRKMSDATKNIITPTKRNLSLATGKTNQESKLSSATKKTDSATKTSPSRRESSTRKERSSQDSSKSDSKKLSLRSSLRNRDSPVPPISVELPDRPTRTRKLFNPELAL